MRKNTSPLIRLGSQTCRPDFCFALATLMCYEIPEAVLHWGDSRMSSTLLAGRQP